MKRTVFYSWQSDLPNNTNRGFILDALEKAALIVTSDKSIEIEPVIDRDTAGVAGAPEISSTIFEKIKASEMFVADISLINKNEDGRKTPNPNVLIELGYALRGVGFENLILVFNTAFGKIEDLPFDLRTRRLLTYHLAPEDAAELRNQGRNKLIGGFETAWRIPSSSQQISPNEAILLSVNTAIENATSNRTLILRKSLTEILDRLVANEPKKYSAGGTVEELREALKKTELVVVDFSKICESIAIMNDRESASELYKWFGKIFEKYNLPKDFNGAFSDADQDYYKFIGHELFTSFIAFLLREDCWGILARLFDKPIFVGYLPQKSGPGNINWESMSDFISSIDAEGKKSTRISMHADMLYERHNAGTLSVSLPFADFTAADFFLCLRSKHTSDLEWVPWSCTRMKHTPTFLLNAEHLDYAKDLAAVLKVSDTAGVQKRTRSCINAIKQFFHDMRYNPIPDVDIDNIGTLLS